MTLIEKSREYRERADILLKESGLLAALKKHGEVVFGGAYAADLMMHGDIDIGVIREKTFTTEETFEVFKDIFFSTNPQFRSYYLKSDWADPRLGNQFPTGHYLGMRTKLDDEVWKLDIWLLSRDEYEKQENQEALNITKIKITEQQREKILEFKKYRKNNNLDISGQRIYEAVLKEGATKPEEWTSS